MSADDDHDGFDHAERSHHRRPEVVPEPGHALGAPMPSPVERLASGIGNRNFGQVIARMGDGDGLLAGGAVHPDVTAAIGALRGQGQPLDGSVASQLSPTLGDLSDARVHTGPVANALNRAVNARAFAVGTDVFFADGEYRPHTPAGLELVAHEMAHVVQARNDPTTGDLTVTNPGDARERDADSAASAAVSSALG